MKLKQRCTGLCKCCEELKVLKNDIGENLIINIKDSDTFSITFQGDIYEKKIKKLKDEDWNDSNLRYIEVPAPGNLN